MPTPDFVGAVSAVIEWAKAPVKTMLILCVMFATALFLPIAQTQSFVTEHNLWWRAGFLFTALYLAFTALHESGKRLAIPIKSTLSHRKLESVLTQLPDDEFRVVANYARGNLTSFNYVHGGLDGTLQELVTKGILTKGGSTLLNHGVITSYSLTPQANTCLRKPEIRKTFLNSKGA